MADNKDKSEHDPVTPDEKVLRRLLRRPDFYDPELPISVHPQAFFPTKRDTDGLSLFRELFATAEDVVATGTNKAGYAVARLLVQTINELDLSVIPDPQKNLLPGHSLIPELNYDKERDKEAKRKIKDLGLKLAKLASKDIALE